VDEKKEEKEKKKEKKKKKKKKYNIIKNVCLCLYFLLCY